MFLYAPVMLCSLSLSLFHIHFSLCLSRSSKSRAYLIPLDVLDMDVSSSPGDEGVQCFEYYFIKCSDMIRTSDNFKVANVI